LEKRAWEQVALQADDTIDPWVSLNSSLFDLMLSDIPKYGCYLLDMLIDHAVNYTLPWSKSQSALTN